MWIDRSNAMPTHGCYGATIALDVGRPALFAPSANGNAAGWIRGAAAAGQTAAPTIFSHDSAHLRHVWAHCFIMASPPAIFSHDSAHSLQISAHSLQICPAWCEARDMKHAAVWQIVAQSCMIP